MALVTASIPSEIVSLLLAPSRTSPGEVASRTSLQTNSFCHYKNKTSSVVAIELLYFVCAIAWGQTTVADDLPNDLERAWFRQAKQRTDGDFWVAYWHESQKTDVWEDRAATYLRRMNVKNIYYHKSKQYSSVLHKREV